MKSFCSTKKVNFDHMTWQQLHIDIEEQMKAEQDCFQMSPDI